TKPGRYGAIVECKTDDGRIYRRYCTLFRSPKPINWRDRLRPELSTMPDSLGIDPRVVVEQREQVSYLLGGTLRKNFWRDAQSAALLTWLYECKPGEGEVSARQWP